MAAMRGTSFDASPCPTALLADLDETKIRDFIDEACRERRLPLSAQISTVGFLDLLNLSKGDRPTIAAMLLFGQRPQAILPSAIIQCVHFLGTTQDSRLLAARIFDGPIIDAVRMAFDFSMDLIQGTMTPNDPIAALIRRPDIPPSVIVEALLNAMTHRDYADPRPISVALYSDRIEIKNPARAPPKTPPSSMQPAQGSFPPNPVLARALFRYGLIAGRGAGLDGLFRDCRKADLATPEFVFCDGMLSLVLRGQDTPDDTRQPESQPDLQPDLQPDSPPDFPPELQPESAQPGSLEFRVLALLAEGAPISKAELSTRLKQREVSGQLNKVVRKLVAAQIIAQTMPDRPNNRLQKYRITPKGQQWLAAGRDGKISHG